MAVESVIVSAVNTLIVDSHGWCRLVSMEPRLEEHPHPTEAGNEIGRWMWPAATARTVRCDTDVPPTGRAD